jgi:hypothetical protein
MIKNPEDGRYTRLMAMVEATKQFAAEKRAEGWTREDFAEALKQMLLSDTGDEPITSKGPIS